MIEVKPDSLLLRRSYLPIKKYMTKDGIPTSRVFKPRDVDCGKLSVDLKEYTTYDKAISNEDKFFLCEVSNEVVLNIGLDTIHDPLPDGSNDAHALIITFEQNDDIKPGLLARKARVIKSKTDF